MNAAHHTRLQRLLDTHGGETVAGGEADASELYIAPTLLRLADADVPVMQEEIFGPILPVIVRPLDAALAFVRAKDKPLALYVFSSSQATIDRVLADTSSGGVCVNDVCMHYANPHLPFGGVSGSGMGAYHGRWGFDALSHRKAVFQMPTWADPSVRYPPYSARAQRAIAWFVLTRFPTITKARVAGVGAVLALLWFLLKRCL